MLPLKQLTDKQKIKIAINLRDSSSFFKTYFEFLPFFESRRKCFEYLNSIFLEIFKTTKYSNYNSFRQCMYRDAKKYLKNK